MSGGPVRGGDLRRAGVRGKLVYITMYTEVVKWWNAAFRLRRRGPGCPVW
jgi:hypothetical protein